MSDHVDRDFALAMHEGLKALDNLLAAVVDGALSPRSVASTIEDVRDMFTRALAVASASSNGELVGEAGQVLLDRLTPRESDVLDAVVQHGTTARAAASLAMSETTFNHHRSNILRKLGVAAFPQATHLLGSRRRSPAIPGDSMEPVLPPRLC